MAPLGEGFPFPSPLLSSPLLFDSPPWIRLPIYSSADSYRYGFGVASRPRAILLRSRRILGRIGSFTMEGNSWRPAQGDPTTATSAAAAAGADPSAVDWRSQLQPEARQRIANKIMETLKRHLGTSTPEGLSELQKIAVRFEEKIYTAATCQADYLKKISLKMISMESKTNPTPSNASQPQNPGDPALSIPPQVSNQPQSLAIPLINQSSVRQALLPQNLQNNTLAVPVPLLKKGEKKRKRAYLEEPNSGLRALSRDEDRTPLRGRRREGRRERERGGIYGE